MACRWNYGKWHLGQRDVPIPLFKYDLHGPYMKHAPLLVEPTEGTPGTLAPQKHAPFVVVKDRTYYMFSAVHLEPTC